VHFEESALLIRLSIAALLLGAWIVPAQAEIYRWRDADGVVQYSDRKPERTETETVAVDGREPRSAAREVAQKAPGPQAGSRPATPTEPKPRAVGAPISIVMYQSPTCGWCRKAERLLRKRGLNWRSVDITASASAKKEFERVGGRGTPLTFIEGQRVSGYNESRIDALLTSYGW
jgi:glutaredoxin